MGRYCVFGSLKTRRIPRRNLAFCVDCLMGEKSRTRWIVHFLRSLILSRFSVLAFQDRNQGAVVPRKMAKPEFLGDQMVEFGLIRVGLTTRFRIFLSLNSSLLGYLVCEFQA